MKYRPQATLKAYDHWRGILLCRLLACGIILFMSIQTVRAERKYYLSSRLDLYGGLSNSLPQGQPGSSGAGTRDSFTPYYSGSPSMELRTEGEKFQLDADYAFSWQHYRQDETINMKSHVANLGFRTNPRSRVRLSMENGFYSTPDYVTYTLSRNIIPTGEGFLYVYTPEPSRQSFKTDNARITLDWDAGTHSYLTFAVSGNYRDYAESDESPGILNDQYGYSGSFGYSRRSSEYTTWTLNYSASRNHYKGYGNSLTHSSTIGLSYRLRPSVQLSIDAGPSYVTVSGSIENYMGYSGSFRINKTSESTQFSLYASHRSGGSSGVGTVSDTDTAGLGFSVQLSRRINAAFNASAFRSLPRQDTVPNTRGINGGLQLSWLPSRFFQAGLGITYRKTEGQSELDREYKQIYISLSLLAPDFWKTSQ